MAARNRARTHLFALSWPLATVLLSAVLLAACSSGPPPPAPAPPPTAVVPTEEAADVCGAAVDALGVLSDGPEIGDQPLPPEQLTAAFAEYRARLEPPLAAVEQNPPPAVRQDVATLARQARFAIENRDVAAVRTPEFEGPPTGCRPTWSGTAGTRRSR